MPRIHRATAYCLLLTLSAQLACGTILYPERRGQKSGRIDPAVAIMDGIGLLLFLIPGLAAFAVDFATGAIYLPGGRRGEVDVIHFEGDDLADAVRAIERERGIDLSAHLGDLRVFPLDDAAEARARIAALGGSEFAPGALAAR
ncbi:MAG TPA: hypothetical protein VFT98_17740 [Myxococcota bacterium]|nr:hypothetical protein [Myxococcota bacterium]